MTGHRDRGRPGHRRAHRSGPRRRRACSRRSPAIPRWSPSWPDCGCRSARSRLQACVSEPLKPFLDQIVVSGSLHIYVSPVGARRVRHGRRDRPLCALRRRARPSTSRNRWAAICSSCSLFSPRRSVLRQWAGLADMTPDFSPVMGLTPVGNYFIDAGWGTWGFKATPICGKTMADDGCDRQGRIADRGVPSRPFLPRSTRSANAARPRSAIEREAPMKKMTCPLNGPRNITGVHLPGPGPEAMPAPDASRDGQLGGLCISRG